MDPYDLPRAERRRRDLAEASGKLFEVWDILRGHDDGVPGGRLVAEGLLEAVRRQRDRLDAQIAQGHAAAAAPGAGRAAE